MNADKRGFEKKQNMNRRERRGFEGKNEMSGRHGCALRLYESLYDPGCGIDPSPLNPLSHYMGEGTLALRDFPLSCSRESGQGVRTKIGENYQRVLTRAATPATSTPASTSARISEAATVIADTITIGIYKPRTGAVIADTITIGIDKPLADAVIADTITIGVYKSHASATTTTITRSLLAAMAPSTGTRAARAGHRRDSRGGISSGQRRDDA